MGKKGGDGKENRKHNHQGKRRIGITSGKPSGEKNGRSEQQLYIFSKHMTLGLRETNLLIIMD
jgi:hypothetical protein